MTAFDPKPPLAEWRAFDPLRTVTVDAHLLQAKSAVGTEGDQAGSVRANQAGLIGEPFPLLLPLLSRANQAQPAKTTPSATHSGIMLPWAVASYGS